MSQIPLYPEKLYYSIGEVAKMFDVNTSLIRFWEKEFDILKPKKNKKGNRMFTQEDIKNLHVIYHLAKERGYTLEGIKQKLKAQKTETLEKTEMVASLKNIREFLLKIRDDLE